MGRQSLQCNSVDEFINFLTIKLLNRTILSVIFILVVLGTLVDFYQELVKYYKVSYTKVTDEQTAEPASSDSVEIHKGLQVLQTFSIYTNTIKLFKVNKNSEQFDCLNAVRFISIAW